MTIRFVNLEETYTNMMTEKRIIKASLLTGVSDIIVGLVMMLTGWHEWYFNNFHNFGIFGISLVFYAYWHSYFYINETGGYIWKKKKS